MTTTKSSREPVTAVTVRVPAKLNLQLSVGPLREDGYHDLVTVFHAVSLYDEVTVSPADRTSVEVSGEGGPAVPLGPANLAVRAAVGLARAIGKRARRGSGTTGGWGGAGGSGVAIMIRKRIPVAAGMAGGSADAAAALVACNELWQAGLSVARLGEIGAKIGSDVPFALTGGTAVGLGRGERLTRALASGTYHWVLAFGAGGLATPDVYAACDRLRAARQEEPPGLVGGPFGYGGAGPGGAVGEPRLDAALMSALRSGDPAAVGRRLSNDLQSAAISLKPVLRRTLAAGREFGALGGIVSGSGPTCAFLAGGAEQAKELALALSGAGVCRAVAQVTGPVPGATVIASGGW